MIEDPPLLTIKQTITRPTAKQTKAFKGIETGVIADSMGGRGGLDGRIKPLTFDQASFSGVAITCHAGPADNLAVFGAIEASKPGDVIIASSDQFHQTAIVGDLVLGMMKNKGILAFVTDGFVRDVNSIKKIGLPCFCMGSIPNSPARNGPGTIGQPISMGNISINSGDVVIGDQDGVVVVPFLEIDKTISNISNIQSKEEKLANEIKNGLTSPSFIQSIFKSGKVMEIK